jgi:ankyrin repeat protein
MRRTQKDAHRYMAGRAGQVDIVNVLVELGANVLSQSRYGLTPLHVAGRLRHEATVRLLMKVGGDARARDVVGRTPLHHAAIEGHVNIVLYGFSWRRWVVM